MPSRLRLLGHDHPQLRPMLSGVASTHWRLDGGAVDHGHLFDDPHEIGTHALEYYSVDAVGNDEATHSATIDMVQRYRADRRPFSLRGYWATPVEHRSLSAGSTPGSRQGHLAYIPFDGHRDRLVSRPHRSTASPGLASTAARTAVDLYSSVWSSTSNVFSISGLDDTTHTITSSGRDTRTLAPAAPS